MLNHKEGALRFVAGRHSVATLRQTAHHTTLRHPINASSNSQGSNGLASIVSSGTVALCQIKLAFKLVAVLVEVPENRAEPQDSLVFQLGSTS